MEKETFIRYDLNILFIYFEGNNVIKRYSPIRVDKIEINWEIRFEFNCKIISDVYLYRHLHLITVY